VEKKKRPKATKTRKDQRKSPDTNSTGNTMALNSYFSINLNVNELNPPIKRQRVSEWIKKKRSIYMLPIRDSF